MCVVVTPKITLIVNNDLDFFTNLIIKFIFGLRYTPYVPILYFEAWGLSRTSCS